MNTSALPRVPLPAIPAGLLPEHMPGDDTESRAMNHSLYRRGILPQRSHRALLKRLGLMPAAPGAETVTPDPHY